MKKILIGLIIVLLLILGYFMCFKSIQIGNMKIESISQIKSMSNSLNAKLSEANILSAQTYPTEVSKLEEATKKLQTSKNQYNSKVSNNQFNEEAIYLRTYKIETLMVDLGRHSRQNELKDLKLDLKTTNSSDIYNLNITAVGTYENIYNFLYSIENDDDLLFEIVGLKINPYTIRTTITHTGIDDNPSFSSTDNPFNSQEIITSTNTISGNNNKNTSNNNQNDTNNNDNNNDNNNSTNDKTSNQSTSSSDVVYDPKNVQAEFTIENVSVIFE